MKPREEEKEEKEAPFFFEIVGRVFNLPAPLSLFQKKMEKKQAKVLPFQE